MSLKCIIVTGSVGGIGNILCEQFKKKYKDHKIIGLDKLECKNTNNIDEYYKVDLLKEDEIKNFSTSVNKKYTIDVLINCAAVQICKNIKDYTSEEWDTCYKCNVRAPFLLVKYLNLQKGSNVINIGSVHSSCSSKNIAAYATTKSAIVGLTKNMAIDLSDLGIRVNCISPGAINTPMLRSHLNDERLAFLKDKHLLKNIGEPHNVFLTIDMIINNDFMNGSNIILDGGVTCLLASE